MANAVASRRGRKSRMSGIPTEQLLSELEKRKETVARLQAARAEKVEARLSLEDEIAEIDRQIFENGGTPEGENLMPPKRKRGRPRKSETQAQVAKPETGKRFHNEQTLREVMHAVLSKHPQGLSPQQLLSEVQKRGYKTTAENFYQVINSTLRNPENFKKLRRGIYTAA